MTERMDAAGQCKEGASGSDEGFHQPVPGRQ